MILSEDRAFQPGSAIGSACIIILNLNDTTIEDLETYSVRFGSNDEAVMDELDTATITIIDITEGTYYTKPCIKYSSCFTKLT